jgi:hypothetical protein
LSLGRRDDERLRSQAAAGTTLRGEAGWRAPPGPRERGRPLAAEGRSAVPGPGLALTVVQEQRPVDCPPGHALERSTYPIAALT